MISAVFFIHLKHLTEVEASESSFQNLL